MMSEGVVVANDCQLNGMTAAIAKKRADLLSQLSRLEQSKDARIKENISDVASSLVG